MIEFSTLPFYSKTFRKELERRVSKDCIFIIQSGYCTTSTHIDHFMHKYIVKTFDNPILIMPQTILYNRKSDIRRTNKVYSSNDKLLFLARDEKSFQDAKKYFPSIRIMKYPDIVTTLIGSEEFQFNQDREGILICVRNDSEKKYSDEEINGLKNRLEKEGIFCEICDTNTELSAKELEKQFEEELKRQIAFFGRHKVVITDRYHGTIFAMISNTPVIVLSTLDHKVKTGIQWFDGVYDGSSYSSDSIEEAYHLAKEIMKDYREIDNGAYFQTEYYDKLYSAFKHE